MASVDARIRYLDPDWRGRPERARIDSRESRRANTRFYDVEIQDARPLAASGALDLDGTGFILLEHETVVRDFRDPEEIQRRYYPEVKGIVQSLTGADEIAVLQHVIRQEDASEFNAAYARYVHCDYSRERARWFADELMVRSGVCKRSETGDFHFAWYNTWQPIENEAQRNPLTLIDARTIGWESFHEYTFDEDPGAIASAPFYSADHHHYYFPRMTPRELIVFKQLDSRAPTGPCAHTSFDDPTSPDDAPPRRSIEVRLLAVFPRG